jgi:uncharacterized membrane protein YgcG
MATDPFLTDAPVDYQGVTTQTAQTAQAGGSDGGALVNLAGAIPIINIVIDIAEFFDWLINALIQFFSGKPRALDTLITAKRLCNSSNPSGYFWGLEIYRAFHEQDIVLSTSTPAAQAQLATYRKQFVNGMMAQGFSQADAEKMRDTVYRTFKDTSSPGIPALHIPLEQSCTIWAPQKTLDLYNQKYAQWSAHDPTNPEWLKVSADRAWKYTLQNTPLKQLGRIEVRTQSQTGTCTKPGNVAAFADGSCPIGFVPDPQDPGCCMPQQGGGGGGGGGQGGGGSGGGGQGGGTQDEFCVPDPSPDGDELSDGFQCMNENLAGIGRGIKALIAAWSSQQGGNNDGDCCSQVVAAIQQISAALAAIQNTTVNVEPTDVSGIVDQLKALVTAVQSGAPPDLSAIVEQLKRLADALAGGAGDAAALDSLITYGEDQGILTSDLGQILR